MALRRIIFYKNVTFGTSLALVILFSFYLFVDKYLVVKESCSGLLCFRNRIASFYVPSPLKDNSSQRAVKSTIQEVQSRDVFVRSPNKDNISGFESSISLDLEGEDVLVYLHIQKTGGSTFERDLVHDLEMDPPCKKQPGKKSLKCVTKNNRIWLYSRYTTGWSCGVHADWTELHDCIDDWFQRRDVNDRKTRRYHYMTTLREPQGRFLSEWQHVQRGATWNGVRLRCHGRNATRAEVPGCYSTPTWANVSLEGFISCKSNLAFNRMTRMLANLSKVNCYDRSDLSPEFVASTLLASAKENLQDFAYFGLTEEQQKSQFLFEMTFGLSFHSDFRQKLSQREEYDVSKETSDRILELNSLDVKLHQFAKELFLQRVSDFEQKLGLTVEEYFHNGRPRERTKMVAQSGYDKRDLSNVTLLARNPMRRTL